MLQSFLSQHKTPPAIEDTIDTPKELAARHQQLHQRVSQLALVPSAPGGPPSEVIAQYTPTTFHGERISAEELRFEAHGSPPSVNALPAISATETDPVTGTPVMNLEETVATTVLTCKPMSDLNYDQKIRMSFISVQGSHGSLVNGFNGLGGKWIIQGFLAINNTSAMRDFVVLQIGVSLQIACGGEVGTVGSYSYKKELMSPQKIVLCNQLVVDANDTVHFPFQFTLNNSYPQAFNATYAKLGRPYAGCHLAGTLKYMAHQQYYNGNHLQTVEKPTECRLGYDVPTPYFNKPAVLSLLSPPVPKVATKNSQTKNWAARWTLNLERAIVGKGDLIEIDVTLHSLGTAQPMVTRIFAELLEIIGYKDGRKSATPVLEQVVCTGARLTLTEAPQIDNPYTIRFSVPKELPQTEGAKSAKPSDPIKTCNPDGEWCGYIVTHAVRVLLEGRATGERIRALDYLEVPVVIVGCNRLLCQELSDRFPHVVGAISGDMLATSLPAYN